MRTKLIANLAAFMLGTSILGASFLAPKPSLQAPQQIPHLTIETNPTRTDIDTNAVLAAQQVQISDQIKATQANTDDIKTLNQGLLALNNKENDLQQKLEVDETKVLQTLKVIGWMVAIAEAFHLYLTIKAQLRKTKLKKRRSTEDGQD